MFKQELTPMSPVKLTSELRVSDNCDYPFIEEFKRWSKIEKAKLRRKLNMRNKPYPESSLKILVHVLCHIMHGVLYVLMKTLRSLKRLRSYGKSMFASIIP